MQTKPTMPCVSIQFTGVSVIIGKHEFLSRFSSRISRSISTNGLRTHLTRFRLCLFWFSCGAALLCWVCCLKLESNLVGIRPQTTICHGTWTNVTPINYPACSGPMINFPPCQQNLPKKFQNETKIALITKCALISSWHFLNGQKWMSKSA